MNEIQHTLLLLGKEMARKNSDPKLPCVWCSWLSRKNHRIDVEKPCYSVMFTTHWLSHLGQGLICNVAVLNSLGFRDLVYVGREHHYQIPVPWKKGGRIALQSVYTYRNTNNCYYHQNCASLRTFINQALCFYCCPVRHYSPHFMDTATMGQWNYIMCSSSWR